VQIMSLIADRADRFVRSVFKPSGRPAAPADPKQEAQVRDRRSRLMKARQAALRARKGF
jgi:hypothetical protein